MLQQNPFATANALVAKTGLSAPTVNAALADLQHAAPLAKLIDALRALPGVGPKTAQRMAFHLLQRDHPGAARLGAALGRAVAYARERVVFGRPIGQNQGVQFPIADAYIEIEAANLMRFEACKLYDAHKPCGAQANMAKYLCAEAAFEAADRAVGIANCFLGLSTFYARPLINVHDLNVTSPSERTPLATPKPPAIIRIDPAV